MSVDESHTETVAETQAAVPDPIFDDGEVLDNTGHLRRARHLGRRSLTVRLVAGVVVLVIVLVGLIGTATYFALRSFLDTKLDEQLQNTARGANYLFRGSSENGPRPQSVWAVALEPSTGVVLNYPSGQGIVALRLSAPERAAIATEQSSSPITVRTTDGHQIRVTTRPGTVESQVAPPVSAVVVIGLSTSDEHDTLSRLIRQEILIGGAAVLIAVVATSWGVRRSLRNLYKVTGTAQEVAAELSPTGTGLERRVPVTEDGTEVGQLAESFNTMLAAVETQFAARVESEQRMRQFLADASHELRTPLTSIRGYAELARMQRAAGDTEQDNLDRIESEGTRMSRLVDDLLMLARGDADSVQHTDRVPIDVTELLDDAVAGSRAAFPDRPISIDTEPLPAVLGDRDQLLRVVRNLVTNAAVHTEPGRPIEVRGRAAEDGVVISVIDGGPGLPPEQAAHVFERFWRADKARTRARGGSGLGLSIVAAVVRAHGGTVHFESDVERGSTVTVRLPVVR